MKTHFLLVWITSAILCVGVTGCSAPEAAGAGLAGGFAASETMKGIEADIERREAELVDQYKTAIETGAKAETLEQLERKIENTQTIRQGVATGKRLIGIDLNNPAEAGRGIFEVGMFIYALWMRKKLRRTETGITRFMAKADKKDSQELYNELARKKAE